uniref:NADH-ubiquinone oxidoreductase chain 6 n=1 Tax=Diestrammena asynamora TaxID=470930 RepID=A0A1Q1MPJ9_9ORTH|nr:NADH dehydrogenase subunit 6 [Diestrammena asynamora]AQM40003.1 NADH dehydrogenase subunit 6 [Diestrammena asynamora]
MQMLSLITIMIMMSIMFMLANHPLTMTLIIILQTLLMCLATGIMYQSFWFSYILFLVFLGGMLVLFIYITSLASNEMFKIPSWMIVIVTTTMFSIMVMYMIMDSSMWSFMINNNDMMNMNNYISTLYAESTLSLTKLYNNPSNMITMMLVMYLFLTLIVIVNITNIFKGPLRQKN